MKTRTILYLALVALLVLKTDAKKTKRARRLKDDEESTPQPSVVSYSTFGFNDVGSYDGFVPSSPGYSSYLSSLNQEPGQTRLYAPAFPTAQDTSGPANNPGIQPLESYAIDGDNSQASVMQYQNFGNQNNNNNQEARVGTDITYSQNGEYNPPIYGTKLGTKSRSKIMTQYNDTDDYNSGPSSPPRDDGPSNFHEPQPTQEVKPTSFGEVSTNYQNYYNYAPTYPPNNVDDYGKTEPIPPSNALKFPKVIDFTKVKQFYPTAVENKYATATVGPTNPFASFMISQNNNYPSDHEDNRNNFNVNKQNSKLNIHDEDDAKEIFQNVHDTEVTQENNYFSNSKQKLRNKQPLEFKDQFKHKPWLSHNISESKSPRYPFKGFQYSTDHSNASLKVDFDGSRKQLNSDFEDTRKPSSSDYSGMRKPSNYNSNDEELVPASSNVIDLTNYPFNDNSFSTFKKFPKNSYPEDFEESIKNFNKQRPDEFANTYKNLFNSEPSITTQQWGNIFKSADYSYKQIGKKPQISEFSDEIVHIPKRPHGQKLFTPESEEWPYTSTFKPQRFRSPNEWNKDVSNRFKSEEDLLGLRTRDTSHPSYLPTYNPSHAIADNAVLDDNDYKKLVEKWKQSYWRAKYKSTPYQDYDGYASDTKTSHVPLLKPYAIEIPHPVIVPVPQPYPVRVPVPKPVAVPVIQELTVPVERPVPYPVYKNVPYPIEKLVPVPIEKKVPVPVSKPYPVAIPHIRPVFHHGKPPREELDAERTIDEDDYIPRPDILKKAPYIKRPSKRPHMTRSRRPSRMSYQDRTRRRWPTKQSPGSRPQRHPDPHRPTQSRRPHPEYSRYHQRYHEYENDDERNSEYEAYCRRTGKC